MRYHSIYRSCCYSIEWSWVIQHTYGHILRKILNGPHIAIFVTRHGRPIYRAQKCPKLYHMTIILSPGKRLPGTLVSFDNMFVVRQLLFFNIRMTVIPWSSSNTRHELYTNLTTALYMRYTSVNFVKIDVYY